MSKLYFELVGETTLAIEITAVQGTGLLFDLSITSGGSDLTALKNLEFNLNTAELAAEVEFEGLNAHVKQTPQLFAAIRRSPFSIQLTFDNKDLSAAKTLSFIMRHPTQDLTIENVYDQAFAMNIDTEEELYVLGSRLLGRLSSLTNDEFNTKAA